MAVMHADAHDSSGRSEPLPIGLLLGFSTKYPAPCSTEELCRIHENWRVSFGGATGLRCDEAAASEFPEEFKELLAGYFSIFASSSEVPVEVSAWLIDRFIPAISLLPAPNVPDFRDVWLSNMPLLPKGMAGAPLEALTLAFVGSSKMDRETRSEILLAAIRSGVEAIVENGEEGASGAALRAVFEVLMESGDSAVAKKCSRKITEALSQKATDYPRALASFSKAELELLRVLGSGKPIRW